MKKNRARPAAGGRRLRHALFWSVLLLPAAVVLFFAAAFTVDIIRLRSVDHEEISRKLDVYLRTKKGSDFPPPPGFWELSEPQDAIFLFGESSVVLSDKLTFAQYLEQDLTKHNKDLRILNF